MRYISGVIDFRATPVVKILAVFSAAVWFFFVVVLQQYFLETPLVFEWFGLSPLMIFERGRVWQLVTYVFLHTPGIFHVLFNMFILWMFGSELERLWGGRFFLTYYLSCGLGAGLIYCLVTGVYIMGFGGPPEVFLRPVIGASGAIFGLLLAYGIIFSERVIYFMMIFPIKAGHFTVLLGGIELVSMLNHGLGGPVANLAHLGGLVSGLIFLKGRRIWQRINIKRWKKRKAPHLKIVNGGGKTFH